MSKHTPGPWKQQRQTHWHVIEITGPRESERIAVMVNTATSVGQSNEIYANARLIAAAPDLLDACSGMASRLREYCQELRTDGMKAEASNVERIAATLEKAAADAEGRS